MTAVPAEILLDSPMSRKGKGMLKALAQAAPEGSEVTTSYKGSKPLLVLYGVGLASRMGAFLKHKERGGSVLLWDLGYWNRTEELRLSLNAVHPTAEQLALAPSSGWRHRVQLREDANPEGPIVLVGLGVKSASLWYNGVGIWEKKTLKVLKERFPGKEILWRPKGAVFDPLPGTTLAAGGSIEDVLRGSSLVVCRHSNVAVDAAIAGIPVMCEDGAAFALYSGNPSPSREERLEFLRRLGWFNWGSKQAPEAWEWMQTLVVGARGT